MSLFFAHDWHVINIHNCQWNNKQRHINDVWFNYTWQTFAVPTAVSADQLFSIWIFPLAFLAVKKRWSLWAVKNDRKGILTKSRSLSACVNLLHVSGAGTNLKVGAGKFFLQCPLTFQGCPPLSGGARCMFGRAHLHCFVLKTGLQMKPL